ncbi:AAA family ATPase [Henriciella aquimarina]|uniref:AAA family ATPase n=1 Tax=Henriciella aquimarina TaxID=545261 RepID=UPI000A008A82|nr:AAA family ATPase [Henriciella aquimarina]
MSHAFIVHGPKDVDSLLQVHEALRRAGIPDWYEPPGADSPESRHSVAEAIDKAFAMVVLVSASSIRSREAQAQIERGIARGLTIVPFRVDNARLSGVFKKELAGSLRHAIMDEGGLEKLVAEVRARYRHKCPVIAVMNLKGGVGKTTITSQIFGAWQAALGGRILLVDLDPQYNLTQTFFDMEAADQSAARDRSVISLFEKSRLHAPDVPSPAESWSRLSTEPFPTPAIADLVHPLLGENGPGGVLDLISGQFEISKYAFATDKAALDAIRLNFLHMVDHLRGSYDLIVFDTNPNATFLTKCALEASDRVIAPMHPDMYSLRGVKLLNQVLNEQIAEDVRPKLSILFNRVSRNEQSAFEADARNGAHDQRAGFKLSEALLQHPVPKSGHLQVRSPEPDQEPWKSLIVHKGRGGGLKSIRESLKASAAEIRDKTSAEEPS